MKNLVSLLLLCLWMLQCNSSKIEKTVPASLVGKWQLVEQKIGIGAANPPWNKISDGASLIFKADQSFTDSGHPACQTGTYQVDAKKLSLAYACSDYQQTLSHAYYFKDGFLYTQPLTIICTDGCEYKYQKMLN